MREGHILFDGDAAKRRRLESVLGGHGIHRRLECDADNCFLVAPGLVTTFEQTVADFGLTHEWGVVVGPATITTLNLL